MAEPMVACGWSHSIFLKNDGTVWGCGYNSLGQLGLGDTTNRTTPVQLSIINVKQVVCGDYNAFFLKNDGTLWGCGANQYGQLGLGDTTNRLTPIQINITDVKQVVAGCYHTVFLKNNGTVWVCGYNNTGQLGLGDTNNRTTPEKIYIIDVKQVACGHYYTIFLKNDGTVWGCGNNNYGQLINAGGAILKLINITDVKQVASSRLSAFYLKNDGTVYGCGANQYGQLGLGTSESSVEVGIARVKDVEQVVGGYDHTIFLKTDGTIWGCGYNNYGQLGVGDTRDRKTPVQITITNVKQVICYNAYHIIFLKNDGTVWGCGYNSNGQLGLGDTNNRITPVQLDITLFLSTMLLYDLGNYKTILENTLQILEEQELSIDNFEQNGFVDINDIKTVWEQLSEQFNVFVYDAANTNDSIVVKHLPTAQLLQQVEDIDLSAYSNIKTMSLNTIGTTGEVRLALSFDKGTSWQTYANGWQDIALTTDVLTTDGLTPETLSAITQEQWAEVKTDTLRIAYVLSKTAITDNIAVDMLTITGDTAAWNRAKHMTEYDYEYPNTTTLVVHLLKDGSYKINYMEAK